jgi:hypothetical protein
MVANTNKTTAAGFLKDVFPPDFPVGILNA